jgi:hypothetical protein
VTCLANSGAVQQIKYPTGRLKPVVIQYAANSLKFANGTVHATCSVHCFKDTAPPPSLSMTGLELKALCKTVRTPGVNMLREVDYGNESN